MTFDEYQQEAIATAIYPDEHKIVYPSLGLAGETGEVCEKIKKSIRDGYPVDVDDVTKELGDVLWYIANIADDLGISLNHIANTNISKLKSRKARGVLSGNGDNR